MGTFKAFTTLESCRSWFKISGDDAYKFMQSMLSCDLSYAKNNPDCDISTRGFLLDIKGRIQNYLTVLIRENSILISVSKDQAVSFEENLSKFIISEDVSIQEIDEFKKAYVGIPCDLFESRKELLLKSSHELADDCVYKVQKFLWGYGITRGKVEQQLMELWISDEEKIDFDIEELSRENQFEYQIKNNEILWEQNFSQKRALFELPLEDAVSYYKGCFLGQEVLSRAKYRGKKVKYWGLVESEEIVEDCDELELVDGDDAKLGVVSQWHGSRGVGVFFLRAEQSSQLYLKSENEKYPVKKLSFDIKSAE